ncbi:MAG TPA: substrate-binding domain-containing protein [Acidimicrobiales bacterium]|nr:substrate-binding domain-containing protein [Acidimicrobiales bacterium]
MFNKLWRRKRGLAAVVAIAGASSIGIGMSVPAGASTVPAGNTVLNEGGSQTIYSTMQELSDLYNSAPGCQLVTASSSNQELNYACASAAQAAPGLEEGYTLSYAPLNPYNDIVYQEPPLGSSNGIKALELQGADTPAAAPDNLIAANSFARSSRGISGDKSGLNFVAFAQDGVSWFHFTKVKNKSTPSAAVSNLSVAQLTDIWTGVDTNWNQVGGSNAPIDVYSAQCGSGTESTWATLLGLPSSGPSSCPNFQGVIDTANRYSQPVANFTIFENEVSDIFSNAANDAADAIFFFSYGKFTILCPGKPGKLVCTGTPAADPKTYSAIGSIGGVAPSKASITSVPPTFPGYRELYNVYSDGFNANLPANSQAVMNFVSTYGFLCNPSTYSDVDPLSPTNATYGSEIDAIIGNNGFFPFPKGTEGDAAITTPPSFTDPGYAAASPTPAGDQGYCRVTSTDGNGNN